MKSPIIHARNTYFTQYADASEFVIPEDLSTLTDEALVVLHADAVRYFDAAYGEGRDLSDDALTTLSTLTEGIEALSGELRVRREYASAREEEAAQLSQRVHTDERGEAGDGTQEDTPPISDSEEETADGSDVVDGASTSKTAEDMPSEEAPALAAGGTDAKGGSVGPARREIRVNLGAMARRTQGLPRRDAPKRMQDLVYAAGEGTGYPVGQGVNWTDLGKIVDRRLAGFNEGQYQAAQRAGRHVRQQFSIATMRKPFPKDLIIQGTDPEHVEEVLNRATDQHRLPGKSLVAAGGWCAPSEILYDFLELESRDGLFSVPEIGVARGGIQVTTGIDYSTIYNAIGWSYTEAQDIAGTYAVTDDTAHLHPGSGSSGDKPCYTIPCPTFTDVRLKLAGLCLTAGLLQQRGYPEIIARTLRGALVAHDHKMSIRVINEIVSGSTAVTMTSGTVGTLAPLLTAIELQVEHYRYSQRLARNTTLEAVFPYWIRGAIRSDLALRTGVELVNVTDAQINTWFTSRGIAAQFVYDWQPLTGAAGDFIQWPTSVQFLLYVAGTWVKGTSDVITLDTIYDSTLLGDNNFTALFTEEGYLVAKRGTDSRVITVPVCSTGATGAAYQLSCDGSTLVTDQTLPTAGTVAGSSQTSSGFTLTVTGASDAGGLHVMPYRFSIDGGLTWSAWQTAAAKAYTGLTASTAYPCRHQVRDVVGNVVTGAIVSVSTTA